jgi:UDP-N-acetylglucosamine/UDP-N-acetylgalactosamine diphosphorylase
MNSLPSTDLVETLKSHGQQHLLAGWEQLDPAGRQYLVDTLAGFNWAELRGLYEKRAEPAKLPDLVDAQAPVVQLEEPDTALEALGSVALQRGRVAVVLVAGGQGSRLGSDLPKGCFPITPVTGKTLYQVHAEKVLALGKRHGITPPLFIMTSPATDGPTRDFFSSHGHFGLDPDRVFYFQQGTMPAVDLATGKLLLEAPGKPFLAPDGHGGCLSALENQGHLAWMQDRGIRSVFYFQVDNPLVKVADPNFLGRHLRAESQASSKVVPKRSADEKVGVFVSMAGRCHLVEYSDLPREMAEQRLADGSLRFAAGSPAIHLFSVDFLRRVASGSGQGGLPFHIARKKVPHIDPVTGERVQPDRENALKFERFIFDALPQAERWLLVGVTHEDEFAPLKNSAGPDSPATVRLAQSRLAAAWLARRNIRFPADERGNPLVPVEISPLVALGPDDLRGLQLPEPAEGKPYLLDDPDNL